MSSSTKMLNVVIPMAGAGSRFAVAGYKDPKPLIPVHGEPMIKVVIGNLSPRQPHRFLFVCQREHAELYRLEEKLKTWAPGCEVIQIDGITEGAACTVLTARKFIDTDEPLMIANSDQYVDIDINDYLAEMETRKLDGLIMTMPAQDPKWSYAKLNAQRLVTQVVEKKVVSNEATVGIYNYRTGKLFVEAATKMIGLNLRVNNEFYVAPAYDQMIEAGAEIGIHNIGLNMHGIGTPSDLEQFLLSPVSKLAAQKSRS